MQSNDYTFSTRMVYDRCMRVRTNIELDDDLVERIRVRYGLRTKTEVVALALRHLAGQPMSRSQALAMEGARAVADVPSDRRPRHAP